MGRFHFLCVGELTATRSGTPNIHIKYSAAEGILTPEGAQASRATGFDPSRGTAGKSFNPAVPCFDSSRGPAFKSKRP